MKVVFNGQLLESSDPSVQVSPFCDAVQFGYSVFETFKTTQGTLPGNLKQHWERLFASAQVVRLALPSTLNQAVLDQAVVQLQATLDLGQDYRFKVLANADFWWMRAQVMPPVDPAIYTDGVVVSDAVQPRLFPQAKAASLLYPYYHNWQSAQRVFETLFFDDYEMLTEGSVSSVVAVINQTLVTPGGAGVLPGTTVRRVFEQAQTLGYKTDMRTLSRGELKTADEIWLLNAVKGIVPVRAWQDSDRQTVWQKKTFPVYNQLKSVS